MWLLLVGSQDGSVFWVKPPQRRPQISHAVRPHKSLTPNSQAEMILAAVSMSTDFAYAPTNQQTVAVYIGVIIFHGLLNTLNTAWLARITGVFVHRKVPLTVVLCLP